MKFSAAAYMFVLVALAAITERGFSKIRPRQANVTKENAKCIKKWTKGRKCTEELYEHTKTKKCVQDGKTRNVKVWSGTNKNGCNRFIMTQCFERAMGYHVSEILPKSECESLGLWDDSTTTTVKTTEGTDSTKSIEPTTKLPKVSHRKISHRKKVLHRKKKH